MALYSRSAARGNIVVPRLGIVIQRLGIVIQRLAEPFRSFVWTFHVRVHSYYLRTSTRINKTAITNFNIMIIVTLVPSVTYR